MGSNAMIEKTKRINYLLRLINSYNEGIEKKQIFAFMSVNIGVSNKTTNQYINDLELTGQIKINNDLIKPIKKEVKQK